ncbi:Ig-like domain-containing protein [Janthinobacterium sp.]|uniref:Ig-like domain-containing protein n=1 Tax=Janthinobacterium sp. TaxID=1871054 RepID=UPI0026366ADE|nr:Ig-like domain-containing protein [Janthinobacterium sp.]
MPHLPEIATLHRRLGRHLLPISAVLMLAACGGGGGGAATPPTAPTPPTSSADTPLLLNASNAAIAPVLAFGNGATALAATQMAIDWAGQFNSSATQSRRCSGGGTQSATFSDADGNGRVSAGDKLSVSYAGCYSKELEGVVDGTMSVTFTVPSGDQQLAGSISFAPGFGDHTSIPHEELTGSLRFDHTSGAVSKLLRVHSDTQPFIMVFSDASTIKKETVTALDLQHELRIDTARATTSMRYRLASELLGGSLEVSTATPWRSWFDTLPDAGELLLTGAGNGKASLRVHPQPGFGQFNLLLGDTVLTSTPASGTGYLWSSGAWLAQNASLERYDTKLDQSSGFKLLIAPDMSRMAPGGALTWIYTRTLDTPRLHNALFRGHGGAADIAATVSTNGAMLTVKPVTQLLAGATYQLTSDNREADPIRDTAGNALREPFGIVNVTQSINANITTRGAPALLLGASATLTLDAGNSSADGKPVSATRWKQLSGPALFMDKPDAARVTLSSATPGKGVAVIELETGNAAGEVDRQQISIDVLTDSSPTLVYSYRNSKGELLIDSNASTSEPSYVRYLPDTNTLDIRSTKAHLRFLVGLPANQRWQAGTSLTYGDDNPDGVQGRLLGYYILHDCFKEKGSFTVLDFTLDAAGQPSRIAIDIEDECAGVRSPISIRYNSDLPVRP